MGGITNAWLKSYLENQSLVATITTSSKKVMYSKPFKIPYGTAQGSCLGPLLFIICCNDIHTLPLHSNVILFADDTTFLNSHKNRKYLQYTLEYDMLLLIDWFRANQLSLNMDKTVIKLLFWPDGKTLDIKVDGLSISTFSCTKFWV